MVELNEFGEISLIWGMKGHCSFSEPHFLLSSAALAGFPLGAGELNAFLAPNGVFTIFASRSFLLAHTRLPWTAGIAPLDKGGLLMVPGGASKKPASGWGIALKDLRHGFHSGYRPLDWMGGRRMETWHLGEAEGGVVGLGESG